jgi:hypothetical protein
MAMSRYSKTPKLALGKFYGTAKSIIIIREAISQGRLSTREYVLRGVERLDTIAGNNYGDASYWWVLAAASNIGWGMQVPPGTVINIPEISDVIALLS